MNRLEAMDKAVEIVDEWSKVPVKTNGYAIDGWKAPTLAEKVDAAEKLASFLWEVDDATVSIHEEVKDASRQTVSDRN